MTPAQNKKFWNNRRDAYRKQHLKHSVQQAKTGYEFLKFNFLHKNTKILIDKILSILKKNGYSETDFISIWHNKTGILKADIKKYLSGEKEIPLWEFIMVLDCMSIKFNLISDLANKYTSSIERDKIILQSTGILNFIVRINIDNYLDFEVDFRPSQKKILEPKITRFENEVILILKWYFIEQARKSKLPFDLKVFKASFKKKWYSGEIQGI